MKRRNPDTQLKALIEDLAECQPAKRTLVKGAFEYSNVYTYSLLITLLKVLLKRLMPYRAVDVFGMFLGAMSVKAQTNLTNFYGEDVGSFFDEKTMAQYKRWDAQRNPLK